MNIITSHAKINSNQIKKPENKNNTNIGTKAEIENLQKDPKTIRGAILATALSALVLGGYAGSRGLSKCKGQIAKLQRNISELTENNETLKAANEALEAANRTFEEAKNKISTYISEEISPKETTAKIQSEIKGKITDGELTYDIMSPPIKEEIAKTIENAIELPKIQKSTTVVPELKIPEISAEGGFEFEVPIGKKLNIVKEEAREITEKSNLPTSLSKEYNNALQNWDNDKIARDVLQNFYDGHGQTLDGVKLKYTPLENGRYRVRISGNSTYTHDKALLFGSEKSNNAQAAGNYGEGLKITVLKLLKEKGANIVNVGSQNWEVKYKMDNTLFEGRDVMAYDIRKADKFFDGSYFEFETDDRGILESLRKTINRFYHSSNQDFQNLDFDSEKLAIKILPEGQKGGLYIAGQRFEFDNNYDGLDGFNLIIKEKLPENVVDPSRDRTTLNASHLEAIGRHLAGGYGEEEILTKEETGKLLQACEKYWTAVGKDAKNPLARMISKFVSSTAIWKKDLKFKFPEKYVAISNATDELILDLIRKGYMVCDKSFEDIGMKNIHDLMSNGRAHNPLTPTKTQEKKIKIIKEALNAVAESLKKEFTEDELNAKIYIFDAKNEAQKKLNEGTLAEAITESGKSKGFWIDKEYLDKCSFAEAISTAMHELSHKSGGDESSSFTYKLTNVLEAFSDGVIKDNVAFLKLQTLNKMWDELSHKAA